VVRVAEAEVATQSGRNIVISIPGQPDARTLDQIRKPSQLRFRAVLLSGPGMPQAAPTSTATVQAASRHARRSRSRKIVDAHHRFTPAQLTSLTKLMSSCIGLFERSRKNVVVPLAFRIWSMACVNGTSTGGSLA
jgi:preprotein translocase subunit SecD